MVGLALQIASVNRGTASSVSVTVKKGESILRSLPGILDVAHC